MVLLLLVVVVVMKKKGACHVHIVLYIQGFAESLQQECPKQAQNVSCIAVVQVYCSGYYSSK